MLYDRRLRTSAIVIDGERPFTASASRLIPIGIRRVTRGSMARAKLAVVGIALLAGAVIPSSPVRAEADQVSALQTEATQISQQLVQEQLQIGGYESQFQADATSLAQDSDAEARTLSAIAHDRDVVTQDRQKLEEQAIISYTQARSVSANAFSELFDSSVSQQVARSEYAQIAMTDIMQSVADLRNDQSRLTATESTLEARESHDRALVSQQATLLSDSQSAQARMEQQQSQVNGELAVAVAQQRATQAAAAAAAIRAAQKPIPPPTSPVATPSSAASSSVVTDATSDPALNPFLQCVVQRESSGDYGAVSPNGQYMGAFQFSQSTWNEAASLAGLPGLIGVPPNRASKADQDTLAVALFAVDGEQPWYDPCRNA
jgi:hypothetical protein